MFNNKLSKEQNIAIQESIDTYQKSLMDDINLILRVTNHDNTYITKPVEWVDRMLIFEAPISKLDWVLYHQDSIIQVVFVSKLALFHTVITIIKSYRKENSLFYVAEIIEPIVKKQQREHFRLDITFDVHYQIINMDSEETTSSASYQKGFAINISTGGLCLNATKQFSKEQLLSLEFDFLNNHFVLLGKVLGLGERNEAGYYTHRIQFIDIDSADSNLLNRLIFEKQRLLLKKSN